ncbi:MAG: glutamine-hydrolyzing GMP synthase, partial [Bacteroidetes bacterium]|nr:glutamine-hydrolyzing GMP synthase [Bacteroidota bacterium]
MSNHETIIIIDFGSQYTQLITRRIREANVYSEVYPHTIDISAIGNINLKGIILSGGPMSVYDDDAPELNPALLDLNVPILGICYGLQLLCLNYGGKVEKAKNREYGKAKLHILSNNSLFEDVKNNSTVWMSHGDVLSELPDEFERIGESDHSPVCAISNGNKLVYGVQFHPEVVHTEEGTKIINNYLFNICKCKADWTPKNFIDEQIIKIKKIEEIKSELKQIFDEHSKSKKIPGIAYGIVVDDSLLVASATGLSQIENNISASIKTSFRIASMTKSFTALAIMKLRDEGKLSLN